MSETNQMDIFGSVCELSMVRSGQTVAKTWHLELSISNVASDLCRLAVANEVLRFVQ